MSSEFPTLVLVGRQEQNYYKKPFSFNFFIKIFVATLLPQRWKTLLHCHSFIPGDGKHCYIVTLYPRWQTGTFSVSKPFQIVLSRLGRHDFVVLVAIVFESIFQEGNRNFHWPRFKYPVHIEVVKIIIIIIITIIVIVSPRPSIELFTPFTYFAGMEPLLYRLQQRCKK